MKSYQFIIFIAITITVQIFSTWYLGGMINESPGNIHVAIDENTENTNQAGAARVHTETINESQLQKMIQSVLARELVDLRESSTTRINSKPVRKETREVNNEEVVRAVTNIEQVIDIAASRGSWTERDNMEVLKYMQSLPEEAYFQLLNKFNEKINSGELQIENGISPIL